jgi:hypothetical protein
MRAAIQQQLSNYVQVTSFRFYGIQKEATECKKLR